MDTLSLHWNYAKIPLDGVYWNYTGITLKCHWMDTLKLHRNYTEMPLDGANWNYTGNTLDGVHWNSTAPPVHPKCTSSVPQLHLLPPQLHLAAPQLLQIHVQP